MTTKAQRLAKKRAKREAKELWKLVRRGILWPGFMNYSLDSAEVTICLTDKQLERLHDFPSVSSVFIPTYDPVEETP